MNTQKPVIRKHPDGGGCWTCHLRGEPPRVWVLGPASAYKAWADMNRRRQEHAADSIGDVRPGVGR